MASPMSSSSPYEFARTPLATPLQVNGEPQPIPFCSSGIDVPGSALGTKNSAADTLEASVHRRLLTQLCECLGLHTHHGNLTPLPSTRR